MVGATGFEPATTCTPSNSSGSPAIRNDSQPVESLEVSPPAPVQDPQPFAVGAKNFVTRLLPEARTTALSGLPLLTVRDVAARLGVSKATVYKLCEKGTLTYIRVSNAIRVEPASLEAYLVAASSSSKP
jgi:excisionase family DNA binding protein